MLLLYYMHISIYNTQKVITKDVVLQSTFSVSVSISAVNSLETITFAILRRFYKQFSTKQGKYIAILIQIEHNLYPQNIYLSELLYITPSHFDITILQHIYFRLSNYLIYPFNLPKYQQTNVYIDYPAIVCLDSQNFICPRQISLPPKGMARKSVA